MSHIYDNLERLVAAALKKEQLWQLFHDHSRSPSVLSEASDYSSSSRSVSDLQDVAFDYSSPGSSSRWQDALAESLLPKLVLLSDFSPAFDNENFVMVSSELLGRGTFGSTYKVVMYDGVSIVLKTLHAVGISEVEFKQNMETIGSITHENVLPLRAYYSNKNEKLMLYDHYRRGSVYSLLHGRTGKNRYRVDWETRLRIAIGAARGIAEIHAQNDGKLVHGNIKASNIFLNAQNYGCVSDLGLANVIPATPKPSGWWYAPEIKTTQDASQASDVYSFGILLLELLTRKSSVHVPHGPKAVDLVKLVTSVRSKVWASRVYDPDLLRHPAIKEQMVKLLEIGLSCVSKSAMKRPKMSEVVKMIKDISIIIDPAPGSVKKQLVFTRDENPSFDLEDMLKASAEVIGKGTFGTSYKAVLENGLTVVVKRIPPKQYGGVDVTVEEFSQHMNLIGKLRHGYIAELKAYYISEHEVLLVYDYYHQDNVSDLLHGKKGSGRLPLDWETRLTIAVNAARALAHIHIQDGRALVHGNIKTSNIFLKGQKYGLVAEAGIAKVSSPVRVSSPGYSVPEVTDTKHVSQASDVYCFGVVLLELVTGKPSSLTMGDGEVISLANWIQSVTRDDAWIAQVLDKEVLKDGNDEEIVQVLQIALDCVTTDPYRRPKLPQVVAMLDDISGTYSMDQPPFIESKLENLLEDLLPTLMP